MVDDGQWVDESLSDVFLRHRPALRAFLRGRCAQHDVDDLLQDLWVETQRTSGPVAPAPLSHLYRAAHRLWIEGRRDVANWLSNLASLVFGPDIHPAARIGRAVMLDHGSGIVIGETSVIEDQVSILQNVTLGGTGKETGDRHPKIRRGVMIGAGAKILGNIEVGAFSKIAAGSVVLKPVPPRTTVAGVPATVVRIHRVDEVPAAEMDQTIV